MLKYWRFCSILQGGVAQLGGNRLIEAMNFNLLQEKSYDFGYTGAN